MDNLLKIPLPNNPDPRDLQHEPPLPGTIGDCDTAKRSAAVPATTARGVENAKKRLRAFSIQKKTPLKSPITSLTLPKPIQNSGSGATILIGKLSSVKTTPKPTPVEDEKKIPKPPKPGAHRKALQDSYDEQQKKTLNEIEDMKRKMELVELGIPLGLICPTPNTDGPIKAMPTKAMPPIKTFLDPVQLDKVILEAKKAKAEGKEFKFDYQKLLPDYDNPFQRKKDEDKNVFTKEKYSKNDDKYDKYGFKRKFDKYDKRHSDYSKDDKDKYRTKKERDKDNTYKEKKQRNKSLEKEVKETDVNLNDYLVCDSWSLDNDEKNSSSPKAKEKPNKKEQTEPSFGVSNKGTVESHKESQKKETDSPQLKIEKLKPVMDSFAFEIDAIEDEPVDMFEHEDVKKNLFYNKNIQHKLSVYDVDNSKDTMNDDTFLESVINEIKQEDLSDNSNEKGLVEYDPSPLRDEEGRRSVTPEIVGRFRDTSSQRSNYSDIKSSESGYRSESRPPSSYRLSMEKDDDGIYGNMSKAIVESLETWSFVLKICQPLLFRHDKKECYKRTRAAPIVWYAANPRRCACVADRALALAALRAGRPGLVDRVYGCDQLSDAPFPTSRKWYPPINSCLISNDMIQLSSEWEVEDSQLEVPPNKSSTDKRKSNTPQKDEELELDREYQRFMDAVWPDVSEVKNKPENKSSKSTTPVREVKKKREGEKEPEVQKKKRKMIAEDWSQESEPDDVDNSKKNKPNRGKEKKRKRKHSTSTSTLTSTSDEDQDKRKKRKVRKKDNKKIKSKPSKRVRLKKKLKNKLKAKQKKKKTEYDVSEDKEKRKEYKKSKKKKELKLKKKNQKKKAKSSSSESSSSISSVESSSESDTEKERRKKKKKEERKRRKSKRRRQSTDSSQSEDLFDVNILNNIKTEKLDDDNCKKKILEEFSPRRQQKKTQEIINVKELQNDLVNIHIKQEVDDTDEQAKSMQENETCQSIEIVKEVTVTGDNETADETTNPHEETSSRTSEVVADRTAQPPENVLPGNDELTADNKDEVKVQSKESQESSQIKAVVEESNSQCSSQESVSSVKERPIYEKDDSHLRPSSQNSNYSFNDVINAQSLYEKGEMSTDIDKYECYGGNDYEMYEQMAMAYQSDVANKVIPLPGGAGAWRRIETVVGAGGRVTGEIKCDWRRGDSPAAASRRPSRWGLKPGPVNIVLTGGPERAQPVYRIESIANRSADVSTGYDEAYMDMYGASDKLQYGDCFAEGDAAAGSTAGGADQRSTLDDRIDRALRETILGEVAKEDEPIETDKDAPEKGILVTSLQPTLDGSRAAKRVSFADGYKPGQDSDTEDPPKKRRRVRRYGCAWPCPASHPDHVPLWDALPPPPPPPSPPPHPSLSHLSSYPGIVSSNHPPGMFSFGPGIVA